MQKRTSRLPLLGFMLLFVVPIIAVFLLARDAQNLKQLTRWAGLSRSTERPPPVDVQVTHVQVTDAQATPVPVTPHQSTPDRSLAKPAVSLSQRLLAPPGPATEHSSGLEQVDPGTQCQSLTRLGEVAPNFVAAAGDWTCLSEFRYPGSEDILFVQITGKATSLRLFRAKLNLNDAKALEPMAQTMAQALQIFQPIDATYVARIVQQVISQDRNAERILGYGRISIERERGDGRRFNIFVRTQTPPQAPPTPKSGFRLPEGLRRP